jgi:hypothetical protein
MDLKYDITEPLLIGYAQSVADVTDDFSADLLLTTKGTNGEVVFQTLIMDSPSNQYKFHEKYEPPSFDKVKFYGQSQFADFGLTPKK